MKKKTVSKRFKTVRNIVVSFFLLSIVIGAVFTFRYLGRTKYNDSSIVTGNTPGNLYNNGLFCELGGTIYFSNPLDSGYLYRMDPDGSNVEKLTSDIVSSINAYGSYVYYVKNNMKSTNVLRGGLYGVIRCNPNGKNVMVIDNSITGTMALVGNKVYFQRYENAKNSTTVSLYSAGIDGTELKECSKQGIIPATIVNGSIYYSISEDHFNVYAFNTVNNSQKLLYEGNCWMPIAEQNTLYFLDLSDNYALAKVNLYAPSEKEILVSERISTYNIGTNYIYFQIDNGDNSKFCRIQKNNPASEPYEVIAEGNYEKINITSKYVYFYQFGLDGTAYRIPANGPIIVETLANVLNMAN